jgi:hypothetical protein
MHPLADALLFPGLGGGLHIAVQQGGGHWWPEAGGMTAHGWVDPAGAMLGTDASAGMQQQPDQGPLPPTTAGTAPPLEGSLDPWPATADLDELFNHHLPPEGEGTSAGTASAAQPAPAHPPDGWLLPMASPFDNPPEWALALLDGSAAANQQLRLRLCEEGTGRRRGLLAPGASAERAASLPEALRAGADVASGAAAGGEQGHRLMEEINLRQGCGGPCRLEADGGHSILDLGSMVDLSPSFQPPSELLEQTSQQLRAMSLDSDACGGADSGSPMAAHSGSGRRGAGAGLSRLGVVPAASPRQPVTSAGPDVSWPGQPGSMLARSISSGRESQLMPWMAARAYSGNWQLLDGEEVEQMVDEEVEQELAPGLS